MVVAGCVWLGVCGWVCVAGARQLHSTQLNLTAPPPGCFSSRLSSSPFCTMLDLPAGAQPTRSCANEDNASSSLTQQPTTPAGLVETTRHRSRRSRSRSRSRTQTRIRNHLDGHDLILPASRVRRSKMTGKARTERQRGHNGPRSAGRIMGHGLLG